MEKHTDCLHNTKNHEGVDKNIFHKKIIYGSFFLRTKTFGHNTFCIASRVIEMDNFNFF